MNLKHANFLSVSISPALIKVALVRNSGVVEKLIKRSVDKSGPEAALRSAIEGLKLKGAGVVCVLPGDVATTKNLEVPSSDPEEIESILALQATRHTPFSKEEILTGYIKIASPKPNFTRVLLIIIKREIVKEKLAVIKAAGLDTSCVLFVPEAVSRFYSHAFRLKKNDQPLAIIDVGMQSTNFIVTSASSILMTRNIPIGIEHLAIDTEAPAQLVSEIKTSLETYEQLGVDQKPGRFVLTSNHMALGDIDVRIGEAVSARVEKAPYVSYVASDKTIAETLSRDFMDESALDVIAAAADVVKCQADLVPQEIRDQRAVSEKGRDTFKAAVLVILLLLFIGGALMSKVYFKDAFLKKNLVEKYADQREQVQSLEKLINRTKILRQYVETRDISLEAVRELYSLVPAEIYLSSITMDDKGALSIQGISDSMSQVFTLVTSLEKSALFEGVKTKSTATKKERGKDMAAFEIVMNLSEDKVVAPAGQPAKKEQPQAKPEGEGLDQ